MNAVKFGAWLHRLRHGKKLTLRELTEKCRVPFPNISAIERGRLGADSRPQSGTRSRLFLAMPALSQQAAGPVRFPPGIEGDRTGEIPLGVAQLFAPAATDSTGRSTGLTAPAGCAAPRVKSV